MFSPNEPCRLSQNAMLPRGCLTKISCSFGRSHHDLHGVARGEVVVISGGYSGPLFRVRELDLHHVSTQFAGDPRGVVHRVERVRAAPAGFERAAAGVRPGDQRHAEPGRLLPDLPVLGEVGRLGRAADVERVPDGVGAEPYRVRHRGGQRGQRLGVGRDLGLPVQLEDQGYLAGEVPAELLREADIQDDAVEACLDGELGDVRRVDRRRIREKVPRRVLEALVVGEEERGAVAEPMLEQDPE
jgi:hypothetical protein